MIHTAGTRGRSFGSVSAGLVTAFVLAALVCTVPAFAVTDSISEQIEDYLSQTYPATQPGATVIITKDGEMIFRGAYGMADLELAVPLAPDMVFRLGSITKQFTGAAILLLEQEGKLSVDDPITKFLPDYPTHGHDITVAHLLAHTSGIRSYTGIPGWMDKKIKEDLTLEELIDAFKSEPMDFAPGERYLYNNSGYVLLGAVVEAASGKSYEEFLEERIFGPLEMERSDFGNHSRIIKHRARGYQAGPGGWSNAQYLSMTQPHAAGSLLSTVDDLARWDRSLYTGELFDQESMNKIFEPFELNDGTSTDYSYGFSIGELRGRKSISHGGGINGFRTFALRVPEEKLYVAVLTNAAGHPANPGTVANKIAAMAIGDPFPEFSAVSVDDDVLEQYVGVYRVDDESTRTVTLYKGRLFTQRDNSPRQPISPSSDVDFFYPNSFTHLTFVKEGDDVSHMLVYQNGAKEPERADLTDDPLPTVERADVDKSILERYVGEYPVMSELVITISMRGDTLYRGITGQPAMEMIPVSETEFVVEPEGSRVSFDVGSGGEVEGLEMQLGPQTIEVARKDG